MGKIAKDCDVCTVLLKTCKKLGDMGYCKKCIKDLEDDKITSNQFDRKIRRHFGAKKFDKVWHREAEKL